MSASCLFCRIIAGEIPSAKVYEDADVFAFRDINPVAPVHVLLVPKQHIAAVDAASEVHQSMLGKLLLRGGEIARQEKLTGDGFRLVINTGTHGGQTVFHLHLHIIGGRQLSWPPG